MNIISYSLIRFCVLLSVFSTIPCLAYKPEIMACNTKTSYDSSQRLSSIESSRRVDNGLEKTAFTERFDWHPEFEHLIIAKSIEDGAGNILIRQTFHYDEAQRLIKETAWKWEDSPYFVQHEYFYKEDYSRIKKTTIESTLPETTLGATYGLTDGLKSFFNPEAEYTQEAGDPSSSQPFAHYIWHLVDCGNHDLHAGSYIQREANDKVRISFINGILNVKQDYFTSIEKLSLGHGGASIHYVCQPTEGLSWDILKSSLSKLGFTSPKAVAIAKIWRSLIAEMGGVEGGGTIIHYAHSIGGTNTYAAKFLLTPEELKMIKVITFGSPTIIPDEGFKSVVNYISVRDGIPFLDPISRIKALFNDNSHIVYVGSHAGIPFIDHLLYGETYGAVIEEHGREFRELYFSED